MQNYKFNANIPARLCDDNSSDDEKREEHVNDGNNLLIPVSKPNNEEDTNLPIVIEKETKVNMEEFCNSDPLLDAEEDWSYLVADGKLPSHASKY